MNRRLLALFALVIASASRLSAQGAADTRPHQCRPAGQPDARGTLQAALDALGRRNLTGTVHLKMTDASLENYQSDRTYPPFFLAFIARESWYQPATGVARVRGHGIFPGSEFDLPETLSGARSTFQVRDTATVPAPAGHSAALVLRGLDPWAVIHDWMTGMTPTVAGECIIRDYLRITLARSGPYGPERLSLDRKTGLPVALEREEPHYLWGQVAVQYVYSNWNQEHGISIPTSSFRMVDGTAEVSRTVSLFDVVASDRAPSLALPDTGAAMAPAVPAFLQPTPPDSVRVTPNVRLLVNRGYTEAVVLLKDTLYLLDATQGEERARADSAIIARLFPGSHPIVLVVTDLAWPHVAGLRYWVARGATVVSHRASRGFLQRVLQRRWTRSPDLYERRRKSVAFNFRAVDDSLSLAGGTLRLYAIDGMGSEGAVMAYIEGDRFLWASDYIQTTQQPSTYAIEVWRAARRVGIAPAHTAAQHLPVTTWSTIDSLARAGVPGPT
jgi:hypothetical protein